MFLRVSLVLALLASPAAAQDITITSNLVIDGNTPDFADNSGTTVAVMNGAHVRVIGDNEILRKYSWGVYDGSMTYEAGNGIDVEARAGVDDFLMTGGTASSVYGSGIITGGEVAHIGAEGYWKIGGNAFVHEIGGPDVPGRIDVFDDAVIASNIVTLNWITMSGGSTQGIHVIAMFPDFTEIGGLLLNGGIVNGELRASNGAAIFVLGQSLSFDGERLTGILDDGSPIDTSVYYDSPIFLDTGAHVPGDTNDDDKVDLQDLNAVRNHFGEYAAPGDVDRNGLVSLSDLNMVRNNFGTSSTSVPEPSSLVIAGVILIASLLKTVCK